MFLGGLLRFRGGPLCFLRHTKEKPLRRDNVYSIINQPFGHIFLKFVIAKKAKKIKKKPNLCRFLNRND
jgi:hypothetical protein